MATQTLFRGVATLLAAGQTLGAEADRPIVLASPVASFHNATLQVYAQVLRDSGHEVNTITDVEHAHMYPYFTGSNGERPIIDIVVSSDLPNNHAPWLAAFKDSFDVVGTCYELLQIYLAAPSYAGLKSLVDVKNDPAMNKTLIGFDIDPCARCPDLANTWIKEELGEGFTYKPMSQEDLKSELNRKLAAKEVFATTFWSPTYWNTLYPDLVQLDMGKFAPKLFNQGKALISTASRLITDPAFARTVRAVSAVFLGTKVVSNMDYDIYQMQQKGGPDAPNAPYIVAQQWIKDNRATYEMFLW